MIALLIALVALAVGKIHGQDTVGSFVINSQVTAVSSDHRPAVYQEISQELQPPPLRQPSFEDNTRSELHDRHKFNNPPRSPIREDEPRFRNNAVTRQPVRMESNLPSNKTNESRRGNTTNNTVRNDVRHKENLSENFPRQVQPVRPENETTKDNAVLPENPTVLGATPTTNLTFDERANFDGSQCPTGYVRVNGKCIEAD